MGKGDAEEHHYDSEHPRERSGCLCCRRPVQSTPVTVARMSSSSIGAGFG